MSLFKKKPDLISDRARALTSEIAALEAQIKQLGARVPTNTSQPRLRSTALPHGGTIQRAPESESRNPFAAGSEVVRPAAAKPLEPVFEEVDQNRLKARGEVATPAHYNELGVRKYDLPALLHRIKNQFRGPTTMNPKLVSYLAAGGVQGLRPMRYEKRVARNRFLGLVIFLFVMLLGIALAFRHH